MAVAVVCTTSALAQQVPMFSHYYYNKFIYNPAMAGAKDYGQLYLINRNQWNSIPDAPRTKAFTIDGPLRKKNIGIGMSVFRDEAGAYNITGGSAAYRYGLKFNEEQTLSFGLALGFLDNRINFSDLRAKHQLDPVLMNSYQSQTGFDANIGVNYSFKTLNIGFSVPQIVGNKLAYSALQSPSGGEVVYTVARHVIFNVNYEWDLGQNGVWFIEPTALVRVTPGAPLQYDINVMANWQHRFWVGAMYRSQYATTFSGGMRLADQFVLGYAYDMAVGSNSQYLRGAHEVMIGYQFGGKASDDPELKKKLKEINDKIKGNEEDIDSLGGEIEQNRDDIEQNREDIDDNDDELEDIKQRLESFEDFMNLFNDDGTPKNPGAIKLDGQVVTFSNVYFETNKWDIRGVSSEELKSLGEVLKSNPNMKIEIAGHADERGTESYNIWLSNKRANAVRDYLMELGVDASQLTVKAYGEGDPASSVLSENRRVEFKILSK